MEKLFTSIEEYTAELKKLGIGKIAFAQVNEKRALQTTDRQVEVVQHVHLELLAYKDAVIYKCVPEGEKSREVLDEIYRDLEGRGFEVKRRDRNIT